TFAPAIEVEIAGLGVQRQPGERLVDAWARAHDMTRAQAEAWHGAVAGGMSYGEATAAMAAVTPFMTNTLKKQTRRYDRENQEVPPIILADVAKHDAVSGPCRCNGRGCSK